MSSLLRPARDARNPRSALVLIVPVLLGFCLATWNTASAGDRVFGPPTTTTTTVAPTTTTLAPTTTTIAPAQPNFFVCKYVGTPGVDESLQTGQNPISVAAPAVSGTAPGSFFNDAQGRSFVLIEDTGQAEPDASACPLVGVSSATTVTSPATSPATTATSPAQPAILPALPATR